MSFSVEFEIYSYCSVFVQCSDNLEIIWLPIIAGAQPGYYLGRGIVKIFVRKVFEKKLFDANFFHFTVLTSQFQKSRGGARPPLASPGCAPVYG